LGINFLDLSARENAFWRVYLMFPGVLDPKYLTFQPSPRAFNSARFLGSWLGDSLGLQIPGDTARIFSKRLLLDSRRDQKF
jgi:hypothetical protein